MNLNFLEDFQLIAAHGGFGKASRASGRSKATLSRRIAELEEALGVRLIERGDRNVVLTEAGELLLARIEGPMREVVEAVAAVREDIATPRGSLRITAPLLFSQVALGRLAADFQTLYPEVQIEAVAEDRRANLVDDHFDVAIRINPHKESLLVGRCFARDRLVLTASPSITIPLDLTNRPIRLPAVVTTTYHEGDIWSVADRQFTVLPQPVLRLSSLLTVRDAVVAGAGVAMLPQSIIGRQLESGKLVAWGVAGEEVELWVLHTSRRLQSPKVRAFVEFVCNYYPNGSFVV